METERILVVDDDPFVGEMLAVILDGAGYAVETAGSGTEALRKYAESLPPSLIISDMNMPGMSGSELIREIRRNDAELPIIILTGNNEISVAIQALHEGANDYLLKDENIQDTITISVRKALEKHHLQRKNRQLMADLAQKNAELEKERVLARKVQQSILPRDLAISGLRLGTFYRPSNQIGGDFFDAWECGGQVHFLIGDISGHNASAALLMAVSKGIFYSLGQTTGNPLEVVTAANRMLCPMLNDSGMFLSLVYATFDRERGEMRLLSAGHNPVYLRRGGEVTPLDSTGPVLGWDADDTWEELSFPFAPGDLLFLYTDGLAEAKNRAGEEFEPQIPTIVAAGHPSEELVARLFAEVSAFSGDRLEDDLTMFAIAREEDR